MFGFNSKNTTEASAEAKKPAKKKIKTKRRKREEIVEFARREIQKGLLFQLPGGSSHLDVYFDRCVLRCKSKTKMEEKVREIPFTSIQRIVYIPGTGFRNGCIQLYTKEMPNVKRSYWYAYENNLVVVHPANQELAQMIVAFIKDPHGSGFISPERMNQLKKERKEDLRKQAEAKAAAEAKAKAEAKAQAETEAASTQA